LTGLSAQVSGTGAVKSVKGGTTISGGAGLTVLAGGLAVQTGEVKLVGDAHVAGSVSITSPSDTYPAVDVYASSLAAAGNAIFGRLSASATNANALSLFEGTNQWFRVCGIQTNACKLECNMLMFSRVCCTSRRNPTARLP
jgi:hypothetical protein